MNTKSYVVTSQKSIPLHAYTAEAWRAAGEALGGGDKSVLGKLIQTNPVLGHGIDLRADAVANLPYIFWRDGAEMDENEAPELPFKLAMDWLLNVIEGHLSLYGAAYLFKGLNAARMPRELRPMHPTTITPVFSDSAGLTGFKRRLPNGGEMMLAVEDVVYIWLPPRLTEVGPGPAPAMRALAAAGLLESANDFAKMYFENGIISPTLVTVPAGTQDKEKQRLEAWAQRAMSGLKKAFNVIGIAAEVKVSSLGEQIPLGKLALPEMTDKKREDIAIAFGIPQSMLFSNAANFATSNQDTLNFYEITIIPEARRIEHSLNEQLFKVLGYEVEFKPERLEVFQALEAEKAEKIVALVGKPIMSVNEGRARMNMAEVPGGSWEDAERERQERKEEEAERMAALAAANQSNTPPPQLPAGQSTEQKAIADELAAWERKAIRRLREGKPDKATEFESDVLPVYTRAWVAGQLEEAATVDAVKAAFAGVSEWASYP